MHPLERCLDLYFLNTAEHFTLVLPPLTNEELLVSAATPYLAAGGNNHLLEIFEAAHSVMLAVLIAPQSIDVTAKHLPFYVDALLKVCSTKLTTRAMIPLILFFSAGLPTKPLPPPIPPRLQNPPPHHRPTLTLGRNPTTPPRHPARTHLPPRSPRAQHATTCTDHITTCQHHQPTAPCSTTSTLPPPFRPPSLRASSPNPHPHRRLPLPPACPPR